MALHIFIGRMLILKSPLFAYVRGMVGQHGICLSSYSTISQHVLDFELEGHRLKFYFCLSFWQLQILSYSLVGIGVGQALNNGTSQFFHDSVVTKWLMQSDVSDQVDVM